MQGLVPEAGRGPLGGVSPSSGGSMLAIPRLGEVSPRLCFTFLWGSPACLRAHVGSSQGAPSMLVSSVRERVCEASWSLSLAQSPRCPLTQPAARCPSVLGGRSSHCPLPLRMHFHVRVRCHHVAVLSSISCISAALPLVPGILGLKPRHRTTALCALDAKLCPTLVSPWTVAR